MIFSPLRPAKLLFRFLLLLLPIVATAASPQDLVPPAALPGTNSNLPPENKKIKSTLPPAQAPTQPPATARREPVHVAGALSFHDAVVTEDSTWRGEILVSGSVTVAPQATLTIEPGTVVRLNAEGGVGDGHGVLLIQGRLVARGTLERPVIFTSMYEEPQAGDWQGLVFLATEKKNSLEQCRVAGATVAIEAAFSSLSVRNIVVSSASTAIRCRDSLLSANGAEVRDSGDGILLTDSEADLRGLALRNNRQGIVAARTSLSLSGSTLDRNSSVALRAENCRLAVSATTVTANGGGITLSDCDGSISASTIADNGGHGLHLLRSRVKIQRNAIEHNASNGLHLEDGSGVAWDNTIAGNGGYDCFNAGREPFLAIGNWWGSTDKEAVGKRIYDAQVDAGRGKVTYLPLLAEKPSQSP